MENEIITLIEECNQQKVIDYIKNLDEYGLRERKRKNEKYVFSNKNNRKDILENISGVYIIFDKNSKKVHYIGQSGGCRCRLRDHYSSADIFTNTIKSKNTYIKVIPINGDDFLRNHVKYKLYNDIRNGYFISKDWKMEYNAYLFTFTKIK